MTFLKAQLLFPAVLAVGLMSSFVLLASLFLHCIAFSSVGSSRKGWGQTGQLAAMEPRHAKGWDGTEF